MKEKIGEGGYGKVYKVVKENKEYAIKLEKKEGSLKNEIEVLQYFDHPTIPKILDYGISGSRYFLILPLFKISLIKILDVSPEYFTSYSVAAIGQSLIDTLKHIHSRGFIYRDIKPENVMLDFNNKIHIIDFGMCCEYIKNGRHIKESKNTVFMGTARYASVWTHRGVMQSRRDDMESLGYMLVFLLMKKLPWMIPEKGKEREVGEIKQGTSLEELCKECEEKRHWIAFFSHVKQLGFYDEPDYNLLKVLLNRIGTGKSSSESCGLLRRLLCCK